jgi:solute carrier family 35 protein E1
MLRTTTLSLLLAGSASAYTLARGPSALSVRPALAKPAQFAPLVRMAEAAPAEAVAPAEAPCIEDEAIEECVLASWDAGKITLPVPVVEKVQLFSFIFGWFFLNVMYNISNKRVLNAFAMPWMMSLSSLGVGVPFVLLLWATGIRKVPEIKAAGWKTLAPIGMAHAIGHAGSVIALGAGAVSFAQTVKAAEPVFTCVMSYLVLGTVFKWQVYASLFPIIAGVCVASLKELSFSYKSLICALISNVAFASRAVLSKLTMNEPVGKNMDAANLYGVLTMMAFALTIPVAFYFEGGAVAATWAASTAIVGTPWLIKNIIINGMYYYLYNEVAFLTLNQVAPITHSIANTVKRVAIIVATCIVFRNPMSRIGVIGSSIAIAGTFGYSYAKQKWP